jgi:hypothetical protein
MLQRLHVSMAELNMEVGLTADAVSSASLPKNRILARISPA